MRHNYFCFVILMKANQSMLFLREEDLIKECKKNSYTAQMQMYNLYKRQVYNASWRILKNKQDAEDAMQESFIKGFQKIDQIKEDANIGAWFNRIAVNHSLDVIRKRNKHWLEDVDEYEVEDKEDENGFFENVTIPVQFIKNCIESLNEKYRLILTLYLIEDYNHREISEQLQLKESTVRNQYRRGKLQLIELIKKNKNHEFKGIHTT